MKTKVEINDYIITIEEIDGNISVSATKDEEVVEEFTIEVEEGQDSDDSDVQGFDSFGRDEEEDNFENEEEEDNFENEEEEEDEEKEMGQLESFQSFINKKNK